MEERSQAIADAIRPRQHMNGVLTTADGRPKSNIVASDHAVDRVGQSRVSIGKPEQERFQLIDGIKARIEFDTTLDSDGACCDNSVTLESIDDSLNAEQRRREKPRNFAGIGIVQERDRCEHFRPTGRAENRFARKIINAATLYDYISVVK